MNWYEHTDSDTVTAVLELPGLKPENITIILSDNKLTISGESTDRRPQGRGKYTTRELPYGTFSRELTVPSGLKVCEV